MPVYKKFNSYSSLQKTWIEQGRYNLNTSTTKEKFGAFSISAAIRGSYDRSINPWYRGIGYYPAVS